ncbi:NAD(P)H-binding protein [Flavobacterium sp. MC2016-06]|uniref:NmrA family NAD(P)-binding protein n=1 Tax=Flavobacterium sp. MC2016-06 TaxID=2676308 RepID=UPI0012BA96B3|nr:NAD(P)H-binding protein [Flavobacterium sp. MC2016-06]MBU3860679.1 NAD(P)H-binding protein [Flavobacterium sp. MC2016-06]
MKLVITGSLGHISKPLTIDLVKKGHCVTVISSNPAKQKEIEALGAICAVGSIEDVDFMSKTFTGADAVYCMLPPFKFKEDLNLDARAEAFRLVKNYTAAIVRAGIKRVIHLSSIGAHLEFGNGLLAFHFIAEKVFRELPDDVNITHIRPVGFYYNLFDFMDSVKGKGFLDSFIGKMLTIKYYGLKGFLQGKRGIILSNYGKTDKMPWVSPNDIADVISEEMTISDRSTNVRYVASEELTCQEIAGILGNAIGKSYLKWEIITDKQMLGSLKKFGLPANLAQDITEMNSSMHSGLLFEDYYINMPKNLGKVKFKEFAKEFAAQYYQQ